MINDLSGLIGDTMRTRIASAAILVVGLVLAACGQVSGGEDDGQSASRDVSRGNLTIGVSNLGLSFPFPSAIGEGIAARADQLGVELVQLDAQGKAAKQSNDVQNLVAQQPDGVLLLPVDSGVAVGLVDRLAEAGIPTVAVASQVGDPDQRELKDVYPKLVALVTQDELAAGRKAGELALQAMPQGGKLAVVEGSAGFAEVQLRFARFMEPAKQADVNFDVVARQPGDWTSAGARTACQNMLTSKPGIEIFYAQSDDMAAGCAEAVQTAKSDAVVVGIGGSQLGIEGVKNGSIFGTVCYKPRDLGELALQTLYGQLSGKSKKEAQFVTYDTPIVTRNNVDKCRPQW